MTTKEGQHFSGFSPAALKFLSDLAKHNDRKWFGPRKHIYEAELLQPLQALVADVSDALRKSKIPIGADPRRSTFRIYRDIRFSHDKSPYKTNLGAYLPATRGDGDQGGLYIHIQPKKSFSAVAFYQLEKPALLRWRTAMAQDPKRFQTMLRALARNDLHMSVGHQSLKRLPRGFESQAGSPVEQYFRFDSFTVGEDFSDKDVASKRLVETILALAKRAKPLLEYGRTLG